jgi:hypothetical protein
VSMNTSINTLRGILVGGAGLAAVVAAILGLWLTFVIMAVAIAAHGAYWVHLHRTTPSGSTTPTT